MQSPRTENIYFYNTLICAILAAYLSYEVKADIKSSLPKLREVNYYTVRFSSFLSSHRFFLINLFIKKCVIFPMLRYYVWLQINKSFRYISSYTNVQIEPDLEPCIDWLVDSFPSCYILNYIWQTAHSLNHFYRKR